MSASEAQFAETLRILTSFQKGVSISKSSKTSGLSSPMLKAWEPSAKPFMTLILTFEDQGGRTGYSACVRHWTVADRETHEKMGFHEGWGRRTYQLEALVTKR
jgi:uncharacterized protein YndB with AHSA1/START domain